MADYPLADVKADVLTVILAQITTIAVAMIESLAPGAAPESSRHRHAGRLSPRPVRRAQSGGR